MVRVLGIDHLAIRVGNLKKSKAFYDKVLGFMGFELEWEFGKTCGWNNGRTMYWITEADTRGKKHKHRAGDVGFHHYAFEFARPKDVDDLYAFLKEEDVTVVDPPADYPDYGEGYRAVYFLDPDGLKLEGMYFLEKRKKLARKK
ncbi:MAG: VOC family protein [Parvibaculum sp.]|uniref:VOC family protein n=1 Tax=Parvibaculum sp. TaxID=2024848 RepID=UPI003C7549A9